MTNPFSPRERVTVAGKELVASRRDVLWASACGALSAVVAACGGTDEEPVHGVRVGTGGRAGAVSGPPGFGGGVATGGAPAGGPPLPDFGSLTAITRLPDPFKLMSGSRIATKDDWALRRAEIKALAEKYIYGAKPPRPASVTAMLEGTKLSIACTDGGKTITFSVTVYKPSGATGPAPALIGIGGSSLGGVPVGIGSITFDGAALAQGSPLGSPKGAFYELYGSAAAGTSPAMAWAWGVSRIIDALEQVDAGINPTRLGVTGCARNGVGALVSGVWDDRIALVIPQESGVGGVGCFRVAEQENQDHGPSSVQTASQLAVELGAGFQPFAQSKNVVKLPLDQHEVIAARAPMPILVIENSAQLWLGPRACYAGCMGAATVWQALGQADKMGLSQYGDGAFCAFQTQNSGQHVTVFCRRFLLDDTSIDTSIVGLASDGKNDANKDCGVWLDWTLPALG